MCAPSKKVDVLGTHYDAQSMSISRGNKSRMNTIVLRDLHDDVSNDDELINDSNKCSASGSDFLLLFFCSVLNFANSLICFEHFFSNEDQGEH
jgi:hypothetical protein